MRRRRLLAGPALLAAAAAMPGSASACRLFPDGVMDRYRAWQAGVEVGGERISMTRETGRFVVDVDIGMRFSMPGDGAVDYRHESREIWDTGWLHALESRTRLGAREQYVSAERNSGALMVTGSDVRPYQVSTYVVPSSLWHRDSRLVEAFIDVESGDIRFVRPRYVGREVLEQGGVRVQAHHYRLRGALNRDAWYDADCALVRWERPVAGGDRISFRLEPA